MRNHFRKGLALGLAVLLTAGALSGCQATQKTEGSSSTQTQATSTTPKKRTFTDSAGRTIEVPNKIQKVAVSGPLAQIALYALAPEMLAGVSQKWDPTTVQFIQPSYAALPELGQLYGGKGELNLETLLNSGAEVVIDIGEPKDSVVEDLNGLQEKTGLPFVHITANLDNMGDAYRLLGKLLGKEEKAETLAKYCDATYSEMNEMMKTVTKVNTLYCVGEKGLNVIAKDAYHAQIIDMMCNNVAVVEKPVSKGTGNEVDLEQILKWNPDVILFAPNSIYDTVKDDPSWSKLSAIKNGRFYQVPEGPYNWMGFPPSVQRYLGMLWVGKVLYPEKANYDLYDKVSEYFKRFYDWELTKDEYNSLVKGSL